MIGSVADGAGFDGTIGVTSTCTVRSASPIALAVAAALLAACTGSDGPTITDPGAWLETYVRTLCTKVQACKADYPTPAQFEARWGADLAGCEALFPTAAQARSSVSSGKAGFDAAAGRDCLAMLGYDALTCPRFWATSDPSVCATVFVGKVAAGGACTTGLECASGLSCSQQTCQTTSPVAAPIARR